MTPIIKYSQTQIIFFENIELPYNEFSTPIKFSDLIIIKFPTMSEDYCVYARNILGRLNSVGNPTTAFNADSTQQGLNSVDGSSNMGLIIVGLLVMVFIMLSYNVKNKKVPESKI